MDPNKHWLEQIHFDRSGFYQKCTRCDWLGRGLKIMVRTCPECGAEVSSDAAYNAGGLRVWYRGRNFFFMALNGNQGLPYIPLERADAPDVISFLRWYYPRG